MEVDGALYTQEIRRPLQASSVIEQQKDPRDYYNIQPTTHYLPTYHTYNLATFRYGTLPDLRPRFPIGIPDSQTCSNVPL